MENLLALHEKVEKLILLVKELKADNARLAKENKQLEKKLDSMSAVVEHSEHDVKELSEEKSRTKIAIADLIKNIDSFIVTE